MNSEIRAMQERVENAEAEVKLHKRLLERTNQPQSYMLADIERSEKELEMAHRKIKAQEDAIRKTKHENEQLKISKKNLNEDL